MAGAFSDETLNSIAEQLKIERP
jgi:hypothetical protein